MASKHVRKGGSVAKVPHDHAACMECRELRTMHIHLGLRQGRKTVLKEIRDLLEVPEVPDAD